MQKRRPGSRESGRSVHARAVGLVAFQQGIDAGYSEAARQFFIHAKVTGQQSEYAHLPVGRNKATTPNE